MLFAERTYSYTTAQSKRSHVKYMRFLTENGSEEDFKRLVYYFLRKGRTRAYCKKVISSLLLVLRERCASYVRPPFLNNIVNNAFRAAKRFNDSEQADAVYDVRGDRIPVPYASLPPPTLAPSSPSSCCQPVDRSQLLSLYDYALDTLKIAPLRDVPMTDVIAPPPRRGPIMEAHFEVCVLVVVCRHTGARPSEIIGLGERRWSELRRSGRTEIHSKTGSTRLCVAPKLIDLVWAASERYYGSPQWPFRHVDEVAGVTSATRHRNMLRTYSRTHRQLGRAFRRVTGRRPPEGFGFKAYRQLVAAEALEAGDTERARCLLRHKRLDMTRHYASKFDADTALAYAIEKSDSLLTPVLKKHTL